MYSFHTVLKYIHYFSEFFAEEDSALFFKFAEEFGGDGIGSRLEGKISVARGKLRLRRAFWPTHIQSTIFGNLFARDLARSGSILMHVTSWYFPEVVVLLLSLGV